MRSTPDPYFLTPHGTVPDQDAETDNPTIGRINGFFLDESFGVRSDGVFAADRERAQRIDADVPGYRWWVLAQQRFLYDVITFAAKEREIGQFVVLRAPLPLGPAKKTPHTHAKAYLSAPSTVLVAREEMLFGHQHTALAVLEEERAAAVKAPIHEVHRPLHQLHERGSWSLDLTTPVRLTMVGDPAHWPGDVTALMRAYHEELPPGSVIGVNTLATAPPGSPGVAPVSHWCGPQPADIAGPELPAWGAIATRAAS